MKIAELIFIPFPAMGHVVPAVETAKLLVESDNRVSTTVLLMKPAIDSSTIKYTESVAASTLPDRMRFIELPSLDELRSSKGIWLDSLIEGQKPHVKEFVSKIVSKSELSPDSPHLAGFVFDAFCTGMKDLAGEFGVPWYVFSSSGAAFLGCLLYLQALHDEQNVDITEFKNSDAELQIPSFVNPMAARLLPSMTFRKDTVLVLVGAARRLREASGIVVNTFIELESHAVNSLSKIGIPPLYPVGPIVNLGSDQSNNNSEIMEWLDDQPPSSVLVIELGLAGEIKIDYMEGSDSGIVSADSLKKGIEGIMEKDSEIRKRVKNMSEASKKALTDGGSSHSSLGRLIADVMSNVP
ncbi:hypothetical protein DKX38_023443 [Salix brachista]|uniref:Uncharacterized protein n=1 Tax=Salix brachista TaxID=2182728 RepID=A0A5N5JMM4_9ROSI|nr:hypothetical protein DKX38_023443 [Salix brachista]